MVRATNYFTVRLFADDTSLTTVGSGLDVLIQRINSELPPVYEWLCSNELTLNLRQNTWCSNHDREIITIYIPPPP